MRRHKPALETLSLTAGGAAAHRQLSGILFPQDVSSKMAKFPAAEILPFWESIVRVFG